jgi:AraC-like DNA-binding protein
VVEKGHFSKNGAAAKDRVSAPDIPLLAYRPAADNQPDMEVLRFSALRQRVPARMLNSVHRYEFHLLVIVTEGGCTQSVDFEPVSCGVGTVLRIRAGQSHLFGCDRDWDGWLILFRPEFLPSSLTAWPTLIRPVQLENVPDVMRTTPEELRLLRRTAAQLRTDATAKISEEHRNALLRHQLCAMLIRLLMLSDQRETEDPVPTRTRQRFEMFIRLIEQKFMRWHKVADYARALDCSQKSLTRAALEIDGVTAKACITARITLEAKRFLAHGDKSVADIAAGLGFDETTNFVKFFKREAGATPAEFRRSQRNSGLRPAGADLREPHPRGEEAAVPIRPAHR